MDKSGKIRNIAKEYDIYECVRYNKVNNILEEK